MLNVRAMIGILAAEQLVGRLRVRANSLVPGSPVTVTLPLKGEPAPIMLCVVADAVEMQAPV